MLGFWFSCHIHSIRAHVVNYYYYNFIIINIIIIIIDITVFLVFLINISATNLLVLVLRKDRLALPRGSQIF